MGKRRVGNTIIDDDCAFYNPFCSKMTSTKSRPAQAKSLNLAAAQRHLARTKARKKVHNVYAVALDEGASKIGGPIAELVSSQVKKKMTASDLSAVSHAEQTLARETQKRDIHSYKRQRMHEVRSSHA